MNADPDDENFMTGIQQLLDMEPEAVEELLDSLDSDDLLALTDAVSNRDKETAQHIVSEYSHELSSLISKDAAKNREAPKKPIKPPKDHEFAIGDDVAIKSTNEETGDDEFVSATIFKPQAPGDTVGVKIEGKPRMVDKDNVYALREMVLGMAAMPDLQRMQELAGIQAGPATAQAVTIEAPQEQTPAMDPCAAMEHAAMALDALEQALPNVRLADLKTIRQRICDVQAKLNEGEARPAGRTRKL